VTRVSPLESRIDELYASRLDDFVAARSALAGELKGADARNIRQLKKPTSVPWAVNQVYWHARAAFERLQRCGAELRRAQIAALEGRSVDVQAAVAAHRQAIAAAVERAIQLADAAGIHASRDGLTRTFEALSLASQPPEPPGRLTHPLQPGGFEMLAGVAPATRGTPRNSGSRGTPFEQPRPDTKRLAAVERARRRAAAAATRRHDAAIAKLEHAVHLARARAERARRAWERATHELGAAEGRLTAMRDARPHLDPSGA
jgi:hypothetical protein